MITTWTILIKVISENGTLQIKTYIIAHTAKYSNFINSPKMAGPKGKNKKSLEEQLDNILKKLDEMEEQMSDLKTDNKSLCSQLEEITDDNKRIEKQLREIKADNKTLLSRMGLIEKDVKQKEIEINGLKTKVSKLEERLDDQEQYSKRENILIQGLKVVKPYNRVMRSDEDKDSASEGATADPPEDDWSTRDKTIMRKNITKFAKDKLKLELDSKDIVDIHTLSSRDDDSKGTVIVRFSNRLARDRFYQARIDQKQKLIDERIYLNEHLTPKNAALFRQARILRKEHKVTHAWTKNCRILVRLLNGTVRQVKDNDFFKQFE